MRRIKGLLILTLGFLLLVGCEKDPSPADVTQLGIQYFPLEIGHFKTYDVEEIKYSILGNDTLHYQLKETVVDSFMSQTDEIVFITHRFSRPDANADWALDSVWTAQRSLSRAISTESNTSYIKLVFPLKDDISWDGNALNGNNADEYLLNNVHQRETIEGEEVRTVTVVQADEEDLLIKDQRSEVYGEFIGLISKNFIELEFCDDADCFGQKVIEKGRVINYSLLSYGKE